MSLQTQVEYFKKRDLTGLEIEKLIGKPPVIYSDLKKYSSLKELLGKEGYVVILYQTSSKTTGHFVSLFEYNGFIFFADSYGLAPDSEIQYTEYDKELPRYLTNLITKNGKGVVYNKVDYQSRNPGVTTCGRYSSMFCLWGSRGLTFREIQELLTTSRDKFLTPDNAIVILTMSSLQNITEYFDSQSRNLMRS